MLRELARIKRRISKETRNLEATTQEVEGKSIDEEIPKRIRALDYLQIEAKELEMKRK